MDNSKPGTYSDGNLEKGCSEVQRQGPQGTCSCYKSFVKRFGLILGAMALGWFMLSCAKRGFGPPGHFRSWAIYKPEHTLTVEGAGNARHCVDSTNWTTYYNDPLWAPDHPFGAEVSFSLPLDSDALYFTSRGLFQHGLVNIEQSAEVGDTVGVRVRVAYLNKDALEHGAVCQLKRAEREHGIGIFTYPIKPSRHLQLRFEVFVTLPAGTEGPLSVKKLETTMSDYSQSIADLAKSVYFDSISLSSVNGQLKIQSVACEDGRFSIVNGDIGGHFSAQSSLSLKTVNGEISPTVNLLHREGGAPSKLTMGSTNGEIDAKISLASEVLVGGEFDVDANLENGNIELKFTSTPVDSVLRCHANSVAGEIEVELDSAFEGKYSLQSLLGEKILSQHDVEDPAGKGRRREITQNVSIGQVGGEIRWVENDESSTGSEGFVGLKSLVSSIRLAV